MWEYIFRDLGEAAATGRLRRRSDVAVLPWQRRGGLDEAAATSQCARGCDDAARRRQLRRRSHVAAHTWVRRRGLDETAATPQRRQGAQVAATTRLRRDACHVAATSQCWRRYDKAAGTNRQRRHSDIAVLTRLGQGCWEEAVVTDMGGCDMVEKMFIHIAVYKYYILKIL